MKNRLLSIFLSICMLIGMMPTGVFANDVENKENVICNCETLCSEETVNKDCQICNLDYAQCSYKEQVIELSCNCSTLCSEESIDSECEVCANDFTKCKSNNAVQDEDKDTESEKRDEFEDEEVLENIDKTDKKSNQEDSPKKEIEKPKKLNMFNFGQAGTSEDNPILVPADGLAFSGGTVYGISQDFYKEQKKLITGDDNPENNPDFVLYVKASIPSEINGTPVKKVAFNAFNNSYSSEKNSNKAMYVNSSITSSSYLNIGSFVLTEIDFTDATNLESMEHQIFNGCTTLSGVVDLSNTKIEAIEKMTFQNCKNLKGVVLPDTLKRIGSQIFVNCTSLNFVTTKDKYDDSDPNFTDFSLPNGLETIENHAFVNAFNDVALTVVIPESVKTIGEEAFYTQWGSNHSINYLPIRTIIVKSTDVSGYDPKAFKYYRSGTYPPRTVVMPNKAVYDEFMIKAGGLSYDKNSISYPLDVSFYKTETVQGTPIFIEKKLYNQSIRYIENGELWYYDDTYELPEIPGDVTPQPGYKDALWLMGGKELTLDSKVTSDTVTLKSGGELEDPVVTFKVKARKNGQFQYEEWTVNSGDIVKVPINEYIEILIEPVIEHPLAGKNPGDIFFWYKWYDSTGDRNSQGVFNFGRTPNVLKIQFEKEERKDSEYYQLDIDGKEVGASTWGPSYNWDKTKYLSSGKKYYIQVDLSKTAENLAYIDAAYFGDYLEDERYILKEIYETPEELIDEYLGMFGNETYIESDNREYEYISFDWKLKDGTIYSTEPGETNIFVWTASEEEFNNLGWTNTNNIPFTGELEVQNPYSVIFMADGNIIDTKYLSKLSTLKVSDFPTVPNKTGYNGVWDITADIVNPTKNIVVTANYTPISYIINYELDGGKNNDDNPNSYTIEDTFTLKDPTKSGYNFTGWTYENENTPKKDITISAGSVTGELNFAAHWKKKSSGSSGGGSQAADMYYLKYRDNDKIVYEKHEKDAKVKIKGDVFTPPEGMVLVGWSLEKNGKVDYEVGDILKMPDKDTTLYAVWEKIELIDHNAYITGYPDGRVLPDKSITRAEAAQIFYNLIPNKNITITKTFKDVPDNAWYADAVKALASMDIIKGVGDNKFEPERDVTRAEFTAMAMRFANKNGNGENIFSDVHENEWFYNDVVSSIKYGFITGYPDGTFRPYKSITRTEVIVIVNNMLERIPDEKFIDDNKKELNNFTDLSSDYWGYYQIMEATNSHTCEFDKDEEIWVELIK